MVVRIIFSSILKIIYVEVRISRRVSESPLEFEIMRVDCMWIPLIIWSYDSLNVICFAGNGPAIQDTLSDMTGLRTVPNVFVNGQSLGKFTLCTCIIGSYNSQLSY